MRSNIKYIVLFFLEVRYFLPVRLRNTQWCMQFPDLVFFMSLELSDDCNAVKNTKCPPEMLAT